MPQARSPGSSRRSRRRPTTRSCSRRSASSPRRLDFEPTQGCSVAPLNATAPFTNDRYDEEPYGEAEGVELSRVHISRTFSGDLEGEGRAELLIAKSEGGGGYTGHDLITGTLNGKAGGFAIQHSGLLSSDGVTNSGTIFPVAGAGSSRASPATGTLLADDDGNHTLTLEYELP